MYTLSIGAKMRGGRVGREGGEGGRGVSIQYSTCEHIKVSTHILSF